MKLKASAFALTTAIMCGIVFFLAALWIMINIKSGFGTGETIIKLQRFFLGFDPNHIVGVIVGLFWAFVYSYVISYIFAVLYNALAGAQEAPSIQESKAEEKKE